MVYKTCSIYALVNPITDEIRYVGKTVKKLKYRLGEHIYWALQTKRRSHVSSWIRSINGKGLLPEIVLLETVPAKVSSEYEIKWIARLKSIGIRLTNLTDGGEGMLGRRTRGRTGKPHTEETKKKIGIAQKGRKWTPEFREKNRKMWEKRKLQPRTIKEKEGRKKASEKMRGKSWGKHTEKTKKLLSEIKTGTKASEETRRKISKSLTGRKGAPMSEELKAKMNRTGKRHSAQTRAKMSNSHRKRFAGYFNGQETFGL